MFQRPAVFQALALTVALTGPVPPLVTVHAPARPPASRSVSSTRNARTGARYGFALVLGRAGPRPHRWRGAPLRADTSACGDSAWYWMTYVDGSDRVEVHDHTA